MLKAISFMKNSCFVLFRKATLGINIRTVRWSLSEDSSPSGYHLFREYPVCLSLFFLLPCPLYLRLCRLTMKLTTVCTQIMIYKPLAFWGLACLIYFVLKFSLWIY